ncbi:MAG TPA: hypothetical protein VFO38_00935 [Candidatus Saccharimonadales bacterium]|nr:hypothetical protein [Candidatus Saccharimonadales bacterium]
MRQRRFRIANALAAAAVVCAASLVAAPTSALAEPSVAWESSLTNELTPTRMFGHMDGKVTAAACGAPSGDTAQARTYGPYSPAGWIVDVPNNTGPRLYACTGQSTLGKDGTLYASGVMGNQSRLLALKDGQLKWSKTFPTGCDDVYAMAMGVNGTCTGSSTATGRTGSWGTRQKLHQVQRSQVFRWTWQSPGSSAANQTIASRLSVTAWWYSSPTACSTSRTRDRRAARW